MHNAPLNDIWIRAVVSQTAIVARNDLYKVTLKTTMVSLQKGDPTKQAANETYRFHMSDLDESLFDRNNIRVSIYNVIRICLPLAQIG